MMDGKNRPSGDIPPLLAVSLLGVVLLGLYYLSAPDVLLLHLKRWDFYLSAHSGFVFVLVGAFSINAVAIYSFLSKTLGINRQGRRLEILTGKRVGRDELKRRPIKESLAVAGVTFILSSSLLSFKVFGLVPVWLSGNSVFIFATFVTANLVLASAVLTHMAMGLRRNGKKIGVVSLPSFPKPENGIVIGSSGEESKSGLANWEILPKNALVGNILITGSIGGGKTQGAILPYLDQILSNFDPRPSVLAIDPKSTFLRKAKQLIQSRGLAPHMLHMKLGGTVKYNPIFSEGTLKNAKFLEIAQMLRAAGSNFISGGGQKSEFWEIKSYDLIKACLVYCAVKKDYYTLTDLYSVIVKASQEATAEDLKAALEEFEFEKEEVFNITCAIEYFEEEYQKLDIKVRTSILTSATSFLSQFQEFQAFQVFCPKKEDRSFESMDEVVDQGKILLFDINNAALARSMGTLVKLRYQQSLLDRLKCPERGLTRSGLLIMDEYQDVVTVGGAGNIGDASFLAKGREAEAITIAASQSHISIENAVGRERAAKELIQNFRTRIIGHSTDLATIRSYQELVGMEDVKLTSHSLSETSQHTSRNLMVGGFEGTDANISESLSTSDHKEYILTGKEFSTLKTFEAFALIYDGVSTHFKKLFLKPFFLGDKAISHSQVLKTLEGAQKAVAALLVLTAPTLSFAFPNIC